MTDVFTTLRGSIEREESVAAVKVVRAAGDQASLVGKNILVYPDGRAIGSIGSANLDASAIQIALKHLREDTSEIVALAPGIDAFVDVYNRPPQLILVGGVHTAIALAHYGRLLGFRTIVVDPRERFASAERFPHVDEIINEWPDEALSKMRIDSSTYIAILTHDPKFDEPALTAALAYPARYVGAIGSRKTSLDRIERLKRQGLTDEQIARIHAPIGLRIGAKTPEEIALSIAAEIVAVRRGA